MKIDSKKSKTIIEKYERYRSLGMSKYAARKRVAKEEGVGLTTCFDHIHKVPQVEVISGKVNASWPKTYVLTSWDLRVKPDLEFVKCLEQLSSYYDAELLLVPCQKDDVKYIPQVLKDKFKIITESVVFNSNVKLNYIQTHALVQSPLAGFVGAFPDSTVILPGLVKELRSEPSQHYVKQLISTGSVGYLDAEFNNYSELEEDKTFERRWKGVTARQYNKPTSIAESYVCPSALIVDVLDDKTFLTRFVSSHRSGIVYDLNKKFTPEGYEDNQPSALVVGDTHAYQIDEVAWNSTLEMVQMLNPKEVILNDFLDSASINHHEIHDPIKVHYAPSLREEADITMARLKEITDISNKVIWLQSNHDNFLNTYLNMSDRIWRNNRNYEIACGLQLYRAQTQKHPVIKLLDLDKISNLKFVKDRENHYVGKVLIKHGHEGVSGARTGFLGMGKVYNYFVCGHFHSPAVFRNAVCVGLTAKLDQEYAVGASGWLHASAIVHSDGSSQLLPIISGAWRL